MSWRSLVLGLVLIPVFAAPCAAGGGGPLLVRVLGWDAERQWAYCEQVGFDETGARGCVFYFDLRSAHPECPVVEPWSVPTHLSSDSSQAPHRRELLARLGLLEAQFAAATPYRTQIVSEEVTQDSRSGIPLRKSVQDLWPVFGVETTVRVTVWGEDAGVRVLGMYRLPGRGEQLAVLSWTGYSGEGGYETQRAVIIGGRAARSQVIDPECAWWGGKRCPKR